MPHKVVFLQHGIMESSGTWLVNPSSRSLGNPCTLRFGERNSWHSPDFLYSKNPKTNEDFPKFFEMFLLAYISTKKNECRPNGTFAFFLAILLAAKGYDVWLGNSRGNRYSRTHARLSPKSAQFWKFR